MSPSPGSEPNASARLDGQVVVLTGASRGLGRSFAFAFAHAGASLVLNGTQSETLDALVDELTANGCRASGVAGDVQDDDVSERLMDLAVAQHGRVDVFIANAGIAMDRTLLKATPEEFDRTIGVNLRGAWSGGRHAARVMARQGRGLIVLVGSGAAFMPTFGQSSYAASKAGLLGLMAAWQSELERYGIRVLTFGPSALTDMSRPRFDVLHDRQAQGKPEITTRSSERDPDQIAPFLVHLCSDRSRHLNGEFIRFDGNEIQRWGRPELLRSETRSHWTTSGFDSVLARTNSES